MGTGQLWLVKYERACDLFGSGEITEHEFRARLSALGYAESDIDAEIEAAHETERSFT